MIKLLRPILNRSFFYEFYHQLIGADYRSRVLVDEYIRPQPGERILDIGCGPGNLLPYFPPCRYLGVDANPEYIAKARKRYGDRAEFVKERVSHHTVQQLGEFDIVLALGVVHHLDDAEAEDLFRLGHAALRPGGRMITHDGCYTENQSAATRYVLSRDRGQFVRRREQYVELASKWLTVVRTELRDDLLRIPFTHLVMECRR